MELFLRFHCFLQASQRYKLRHKNEHSDLGSPEPVEYEIPLSSVGHSSPANQEPKYTTLQGTHRETKELGAEYTSINPQSLDEPSYYKAAHGGRSLFRDSLSKEMEADEGGVNPYLEVVPSVPAHAGSSRGSSPMRLTGLANSREDIKNGKDITSPDVLDGESVDVYDYVNADLGPM